MKQVIFYCTTCEDWNKSNMGTPLANREGLREYKWESLTEVWEHVLNNFNEHHIIAKIDVEND